MEQTDLPKYTSDSYIPFPSDEIVLNSRLTDDRNVNRHQTPSLFGRRNRNLFSDSSHIPWKTKTYSCGVIG